MHSAYNLLLYLALPFALLRLFWRSRRLPAYRERWSERLGSYDGADLGARVWVHAVSVGEVQAAQPVIRHLLDHYPGKGVMVTTTTPTGSARLRALFEHRVRHVYVPYDLQPAVERFLDAVAPRLVLVMETEVWPNMLRACERRGIPVILANARLSQRSAQGYARLGGFARETFARFAVIAAQAQADATRFMELGAPPDRVQVTGSIKFDLHLPASLREQAEVMRRLWGSERPVWVAASTHEGEEEQLLAVHRRVCAEVPEALLVLVPRHPDRFERVAGLIAREGLTLARRSKHQPCTTQTAIFLGDTMGELQVFLAAADIAFIGGSLVKVGGHNLLEAAAVGVPAVIGPHSFNFATITRLMVEEGAAAQVADAAGLTRQLCTWLTDAAERARIGENALRVLAENRGALPRLLGLVDGLLERGEGAGAAVTQGAANTSHPAGRGLNP
jgi:3-deoxy-D-manno-octulosonic-acid transferase